MAAIDLMSDEERLRLINSLLQEKSRMCVIDKPMSEENGAIFDHSISSFCSLIMTPKQNGKGPPKFPTETIDTIAIQMCLPLFKHMIATTSHVTKTKELIELTVTCFPMSSKEVQLQMVAVVIDTLSAYSTERGLTHFKEESAVAEGVFIAVDFASKLFQSEPCKKILEKHGAPDQIFNEVIKAMFLAEDKVAGQILGTLFQELPVNAKGKREAKLADLWSVITATYEKHGQKTFISKEHSEMSERACLLLCGMADWFFPVTGLTKSALQIVNQPYFWELLQSGFFNANSLTRKRTLYLFKRILDIIETNKQKVSATESKTSDPVFWWTADYAKEISAIWEDFFLLMETLEEKQVHTCLLVYCI